MPLNSTKIPSGFLVEGTDNKGTEVEVFYTSEEAASYIKATEFVKAYKARTAFEKERAALPDPERDLYLKHFGADEEAKDSALTTVLSKGRNARDHIEVNWAADPVMLVLHLIDLGESSRLRQIGGELVDMGPR